MESYRIGDVAKVRNGYAFSSDDFQDNGIPVIRMSDLDNFIVDTKNAARVPESFLNDNSDFKISKGDLIIGMSGSIGKVAVYQSDAPALQNQRVGVFKILDDAKLDFAYLKFFAFTLEAKLLKLGKGVAIKNVSAQEIEDLAIPLPPLPEQQRIAAILDRADRLRRTRRCTAQLSDSFLQAVFIEMFGDHLLPDQPKTPLGDLVTITGGGTPSRDVEKYFTGDIPWLTSKDMHGDYIYDTEEHITEEAIQNSATKLIPAGSILLVVKSKILMHRLPIAIAMRPMCHGQDIKSIQCSDKVTVAFVVYVLKHNEPKILYQARGANTEGLTLPMLEEVPVPNAPLALQEKFAHIVQQFDRLRAQQREAERQAEHLFQALLHRAFGGEL